jgi:hypothetical protein
MLAGSDQPDTYEALWGNAVIELVGNGAGGLIRIEQ